MAQLKIRKCCASVDRIFPETCGSTPPATQRSSSRELRTAAPRGGVGRRMGLLARRAQMHGASENVRGGGEDDTSSNNILGIGVAH